MPTNEEGEFELILGNRQLLSVFFIVVILLGLFFTMGYIVGQHSTPLVAADNTPAKTNAKPIVVDSSRDTTEPESTPASEPAPSKPITTAPQQPPEVTKAEPPKSAPPKSGTAKSEPLKSEAKSEPQKSEPSKSKSAPEPRPASSGSSPSGTYLQLAATTKREADIMVDVLRQKKFAAIAAEIPDKPGLFRVLVGPIADSQVNKTKTDLQSAGFPGDKSIKRSF